MFKAAKDSGNHRQRGRRNQQGFILWVSALAVVLLGLSAAYFQVLYQLSEETLYFFQSAESWQIDKRRTCNPTRVNYIYADLRPETLAKADKNSPREPLEYSCQTAYETLPYTHHFARNIRDMKVHYVRYADSAIKADAPILLFIPGISANFLAGGRYYGMARRLGAELVIMEPTNHGWSDDDGKGAAYGCREKDDVVAVVNTLLSSQPHRKMYIFTTSMGGMTLTNALPQLQPFAAQIFGVTLENPPSALVDVMQSQAKKRSLPLFMVDQVHWLAEERSGHPLNACATIHQVKHLFTPTQVTFSKKDYLISQEMVEKVVQQLPQGFAHRFTVYPYGGHSIIWNGQPEVFEKDLQDFWNDSLVWHQKVYQGSTEPSQ